jgi:hypothetical protein
MNHDHVGTETKHDNCVTDILSLCLLNPIRSGNHHAAGFSNKC